MFYSYKKICRNLVSLLKKKIPKHTDFFTVEDNEKIH